MASFAFFDSFTTAQTLADGEFGFIGDTGSLEVDGDAITATGDVARRGLRPAVRQRSTPSTTIDGVVRARPSASDGRVARRDGDAIVADDVDRRLRLNRGRIVSGEDALDIRGTGPISIVNNGTLIGESDGHRHRVGRTGLTRIVNNGTIDGVDGGIDHLGGDSLLINRGTIAERRDPTASRGRRTTTRSATSARSRAASSWTATTTSSSTAA